MLSHVGKMAALSVVECLWKAAVRPLPIPGGMLAFVFTPVPLDRASKREGVWSKRCSQKLLSSVPCHPCFFPSVVKEEMQAKKQTAVWDPVELQIQCGTGLCPCSLLLRAAERWFYSNLWCSRRDNTGFEFSEWSHSYNFGVLSHILELRLACS